MPPGPWEITCQREEISKINQAYLWFTEENTWVANKYSQKINKQKQSTCPCTTSIAVRKMQIKTATTHYLSHTGWQKVKSFIKFTLGLDMWEANIHNNTFFSHKQICSVFVCRTYDLSMATLVLRWQGSVVGTETASLRSLKYPLPCLLLENSAVLSSKWKSVIAFDCYRYNESVLCFS